MKLYVASSWRNNFYPDVVRELRIAGHEVHDWRISKIKGSPYGGGFHWSDVDGGWQNWTPLQYVVALQHPIANVGFANDMKGVHWCEAMVYLMPCGVSASLEAAYAKGRGKMVICYVPEMREPDLMVKMFDLVTTEFSEVLAALRWMDRSPGRTRQWTDAKK